MTRKRFVKLMMSKGYDRNEANAYAQQVRENGRSYETAYAAIPFFVDALIKLQKVLSKFVTAATAALSAFGDTFHAKMQE